MREQVLPPSWDGSVVLDIGGDVGALMLRTPPAMLDAEIELDSEDTPLSHTHSAVRERQLANGRSYAAVYPHLKAGRYVVRGSGQRITIHGGRVTDVDLELESRAPTMTSHSHAHVVEVN
jgi:hypothetical protein